MAKNRKFRPKIENFGRKSKFWLKIEIFGSNVAFYDGIRQTISNSVSSIREISLLKDLKHENIVKLIDVSLEEEQLFLIFEYLNCDLKYFLDKKRREKNKLDPTTVKSYTFQILQVQSWTYKRTAGQFWSRAGWAIIFWCF